MTDTANPFLVARVDSTTIWSGFWIAEDIADLTSAYERGDWIDGLIGGFGTTMDALAYVFDPVGSLVASGIAWAIEQIKPVSDVLDWLAGDPDQIVAYAQTWRNIATSMSQAATDYAEAVDREIASWTGAAADAYRRLANDHCGRLSTLGMAIGLLGTFVEGAGLVVSLLRGIVRDAIATFVSILIVRAPEWIAITAGTIGIASPWVVGQIGSLVGEWATKIARLLKAMINTIRRVMPMKHQLGEAIEALGHGSKTPSAPSADHTRSPSDPRSPSEKADGRDETEAGHSADDPNLGRLRDVELATLRRAQAEFPELGLNASALERDGEYVDKFGRTYDQMGNPRTALFWNSVREQQFYDAIDDHLRKSVTFTLIDLTGFSEEAKASIRMYVDSLSPMDQDRIIRVGF